MPNDSPLKAVIVTLLVCLIGSLLVAGSAVLLRPAQTANKERDQRARLAEIMALLPNAQGAHLEARVVDLATGRFESSIEAGAYDQRRAARDPGLSVAIPRGRDIAQLKRRARFAVVNLVTRPGRLDLVILPIHGRGFGSTIYGYLGLSGDLRTVVGLSFYEHGETPGLGALIDDASWRRQWRGKQVWDSDGAAALGVAKGAIEPSAPDAAHLVDGLTGATWTSRGVTNLLRFWLGPDGFGPFLDRLRRQRGS
jgi:Na+-transporting NADH:ubiquinone oxidoreductase subunit C